MNALPYSRRDFHFLLGLSTVAGVQACSLFHKAKPSYSPTDHYAATAYLPEIIAVEKARPVTGRRTEISLTPQLHHIDLGGPVVTAAVYGSSLPGNVVRAHKGDILAATIENHLPNPTNVHWHGLSMRNDADGAITVTQPLASPGRQKLDFAVTEPGTYWIHPHYGMDTDFGLYAPLIIDDPQEPLKYDTEWIVVLDDWTQGIGPDPTAIFRGLMTHGMYDARNIYSDDQARGVSTPGLTRIPVPVSGKAVVPSAGTMPDMPGMSGMGSTPPNSAPGTSETHGAHRTSADPTSATPLMCFRSITAGPDHRSLVGDIGDVHYPYYLINGRIPASPSSFRAKPGQKIRIRIINAAADTAFTVALAGHKMRITHCDGAEIVPATVDSVVIGMGERYDVLVTAQDGVFPLVARAEAKNDIARALFITGQGQEPPIGFRPAELQGKKFLRPQFTGLHSAKDLGLAQVDKHGDYVLGGSMMGYNWSINGMRWPEFMADLVTKNSVVQVNFKNNTDMWHPMHLHGHRMYFPGAGGTVVNKDTVMVAPRTCVSGRIKCDNPGAWMVHCHNGYHMDAGMMTRMDYQ